MGNRIRAFRKAAGLRQEDLARELGVTRQTINAIENNKYDPTLPWPCGWPGCWVNRWRSCFSCPSEACFCPGSVVHCIVLLSGIFEEKLR